MTESKSMTVCQPIDIPPRKTSMPNDFSGQSKNNSQSFIDSSISRTVQTHLGKQLRQLFGPIEDDPLPDNLRRLVEQLDEAWTKKER